MSSLKFGSNIDSLRAQRQLAKTGSDLGLSFERLASGLRINRASDDAAGVSISSHLKVDARVYSQAIRNANDGISALNIAEGATSQLSSIVVRLRELATSSASGTYTLKQRTSIDSEAKALTDEFNRITASTKFNKLNLLDGSLQRLAIQLGYGANQQVSTSVGGDIQRNVNSDGTFQEAQNTSTGAFVSKINTGDLNNDGRDDLAVYTLGGGIEIYLGNADGTLTAGTAVAGTYTAVGLADMNNDGKLDLVTSVTGGSANIKVAFGNGDGTFQTASTVAAVGGSQIAIGDFNGDGASDIALRQNSAVSVYTNNGNGTFGPAVSTSISGTNSQAMYVADLNGDGKDDLITRSSAGTTQQALISGGNGSFSTRTFTTSFGFTAAALGDFNHDGKVDIVGADLSGSVSIMTGAGDGTFTETALYSLLNPGGGTAEMRVVDFNGDGNQDIVCANSSSFELMTNDGNGNFTVSDPGYYATGAPARLNVGDFNGDGVSDVVTSDSLADFDIFIANKSQTTEIQRLDLTSVDGAREAMDLMDALMADIASERAQIGATQNRLLSATRTLFAVKENLLSANSRIEDLDVASEAVKLVSGQIRQEIGSAVLAQANHLPQLVIQLLRE